MMRSMKCKVIFLKDSLLAIYFLLASFCEIEQKVHLPPCLPVFVVVLFLVAYLKSNIFKTFHFFFLLVCSEVWWLHGEWRRGLQEQRPHLWCADRWIHLCPTRGSQPGWTDPVETDSKRSTHTSLGDYGAAGTDWPTVTSTNWKWGEFHT